MSEKVRVWMIWRTDLVDFDQPTIPQLLFTDPVEAAEHAEDLALEHGEEFAIVPADILPRDEWAGVSIQVQ